MTLRLTSLSLTRPFCDHIEVTMKIEGSMITLTPRLSPSRFDRSTSVFLVVILLRSQPTNTEEKIRTAGTPTHVLLPFSSCASLFSVILRTDHICT